MRKFKSINKFTRTGIISYLLVSLGFAIIFPLQQLELINHSLSGQLVPICTSIVMALSLNLTVGFLGELSLGHAGFVSVGAFSGVIAAAGLQDKIAFEPLRLLIAVIIGGICAGIVGLIIGVPVLRLRGDYLAIVTLAFGEIIKNIINCLYVGVDKSGLHISMNDVKSLGMENGKIILNGPQGAVGIDQISSFTAGVILILFALFIILNLVNSKSGRAVMAIRDNRIAAESVGINISKYKLIAFITSSVLAGMAGVVYAMNYSTIVAKKFDFNTSILILVFVVLGGMGNIVGTIIATVVLYMLPELLREFSDFRMLIYAVILIVVMLLTNNEKVKLILSNTTGKLLSKSGKIIKWKGSADNG